MKLVKEKFNLFKVFGTCLSVFISFSLFWIMFLLFLFGGDSSSNIFGLISVIFFSAFFEFSLLFFLNSFLWLLFTLLCVFFRLFIFLFLEFFWLEISWKDEESFFFAEFLLFSPVPSKFMENPLEIIKLSGSAERVKELIL